MTVAATPLTVEELERRAYANGDVKNALLLAARHQLETSDAYQLGYQLGYDAGYDDGQADRESNSTDWDQP